MRVDDTKSISAMLDHLRFSTQELEKARKSAKKNFIKCNIISPDATCNIGMNGEEIERVDSFAFLGSVVPETSDDVKRRIALASSAFGRLTSNIWSRREKSKEDYIYIYVSKRSQKYKINSNF